MQKKQAKSVKQGAKTKTTAKAPAKAKSKSATRGTTRAAATSAKTSKASTKAASSATKTASKSAKGAKAPKSVAPSAATLEAAARAAAANVPRRRRDEEVPVTSAPKTRATPAVLVQPSRAFSFEDAGRTFNCRVEPLRPSGTDAWWWFEVSTEQHQRHAPFRAEQGDTTDDVRARVVRYYDEMMARRAEPAPNRWSRRPSAPGQPAVAAPAAGVEEAAPDEEGVEEVPLEEAELEGTEDPETEEV